MPLSDRDYMRRTPPPPRRRTWRFDTSGDFSLNPIWALIIINVIVYIVTAASDDAFFKLGLIPSILGERPWTIITSMFAHANLTHLLFNMIALFFFGSLSTADEAIPTFVYFIVPILFVFFFSFALNMALQYKKVGPWRNYLFGERMYVLLSLVAKSALAWQVFMGTLRPV